MDSAFTKLHEHAPEGLILTRRQLRAAGISDAALDRYVKSGWLRLVGRGAYIRGPSRLVARPLRWQQVAMSLQLAGVAMHVGGPAALALHGYHELMPDAAGEHPVFLFGKGRMPGWFSQAKVRERYHLSRFELLPRAPRAGLLQVPWGPWDWSIWTSAPERALLELLALVPDTVDFELADKVFRAAANLEPAQLNALLGWSRHVRVNRLFLWFADRHSHWWNGALQRERVFTGSGKRQVVAGGRFDSTYQITVPAGM